MRRLAVAAAAALAWGCSSVGEYVERKTDYRSGGPAKTLPPLEVPPDLTAPERDSRYIVPEQTAKSTATFSGYQAERGQRPGTPVLPTYEDMRLERAGATRWLVVQAPPEKLWPVLKDFWKDNGFEIEVERPETGVMETAWAENRAKIPLDPVRKVLGRVFNRLFSTGQLDKFRTRLERAPEGGTEIYISHRGVEEVYDAPPDRGPSDNRSTVWQPRPIDPGLEAEFLQRLMVKLGAAEEKAKAIAAGTAPPEFRAEVRKGVDGKELLEVFEPFDRAWRRVGLALDRVGFTVEDRDRQKGLYFVRYADPENKKDERGLFSRLFGSEPEVKPEQYRVHVTQAGTSSRVNVLDRNGADDASKTASRILSLLHEQLK